MLLNNFDLPNASRLVHRRFGEKIMEPELPMQVDGQRNLFGHLMAIAKMAQNPEPHGIQTVVVDTVGELYRRLLEEFSNRSVRPSLPTYGEVSVQVERFCRGLCVAPGVNTVLIAGELLQQDGEDLVSVPFTGTKSGSADLGMKLQSMVDIVAYAGMIEMDDAASVSRVAASRDNRKLYVSQLVPLKGRLAGDRYDCLGDWRPNDLTEWLETIVRYESGEEIDRFDLPALGLATPPVETDQPDESNEPNEPDDVAESQEEEARVGAK